MKVLITGGSSLLGKHLSDNKQADIKSTWYTNHIGSDYQMDVCNQSQVRYVFHLVKPDVVIHCAAVGSVDYAEKEFALVKQVNVDGMMNVARSAHEYRAKFVYISTNAVFDGNNPPYNEDSERNPVNRYGSIKREAENRVMELRDWLIIRPFLLYGWPYKNARSNWFVTILSALMDKRPFKLVNDVWWQPTDAPSAARAIWQIIDRSDKNQVYHLATDDRATLYEFGLLVAKVWGYQDIVGQLLTPVGSDEFADMAPRPKDTTFDLAKLKSLGIELPGIEEGLKRLR